jgi:hypothetical protein
MVAERLCVVCLVSPDSPALFLDLQLCARAPNLRFLGAERANPGCFCQEAQIPDLRFLGDFSRNGCASWQKHGKYHRFWLPVLGRSGKAFALLGKFRAFIAKMVALLGKSSALFTVFPATTASQWVLGAGRPGGVARDVWWNRFPASPRRYGQKGTDSRTLRRTLSLRSIPGPVQRTLRVRASNGQSVPDWRMHPGGGIRRLELPISAGFVQTEDRSQFPEEPNQWPNR